MLAGAIFLIVVGMLLPSKAIVLVGILMFLPALFATWLAEVPWTELFGRVEKRVEKHFYRR